jgi:serine/threonine protein phosphatase PrpC
MNSERLQTCIGFASEQGKRETNDDFVVAHEAEISARAVSEAVVVIADGISGPGGRLAAETVARGFLDGYLNQSLTLGVDRAAARSLAAMNRWVHGQGRQDQKLRDMATTFSALILRGRVAHVVHVGDTRIYRLRDGRLQCLTHDHTHSHPDMQHVLFRAVGLEETVRADYEGHDLKAHDRYLLCCDGVHASLNAARLKSSLAERAAPEAAARRIVDEALAAGSQDNVTALVLDVLAVPPAEQIELEALAADMPILELPKVGDTVDDFRLLEMVSDGRYSRLFRAEDMREARELILKFPHPRVAAEANYRRAFVREAWVASQVRSPYVGEVIELPPGRQTRLYSAMPFYPGETLAQRLLRQPPVTLDEGASISTQLAKAVYALNRRHIIHRDVKPENVMLAPDGGLRLLDLGVARLPGLEIGATSEEIPGTPSYMAPELFNGEVGDERSDLYALGVTLYCLWSSGHYPFGEVEAFSRPRFNKRVSLSRYRPDLPAWLDAMLARATAVEPTERYGDAMELAFEFEHNLVRAPRVLTRRLSLYERDPLRFWQVVSLLLLLALIWSLGTG